MDKNFFPFVKNPDGESIFVSEIYDKVYYSKALADILEIVSVQYRQLKGE